MTCLFSLAFLGRPARSVPAAQFAPAPSEPEQSSTAAELRLSSADLAMQRHAEGDDLAFAEVFAELAPRLRLFLRRLGANGDVAEDLAQETFLRMHGARGSFARGKPVAPWAYSIARNCFISYARSAKHKLERTSVAADHVELPGSSAASAEEENIARQSARVIHRVLDSLTPARREAFVLLRYEGLSVAEAAQIVGISEGALKIRAFHAYEALRQALAAMDEPSNSGGAERKPFRERSVSR
jgi:RNA polymerase sigma-70 factor (ECF subfamily)